MLFSLPKPTVCFLSFAQNNIINFITVNNYRKELGNVASDKMQDVMQANQNQKIRVESGVDIFM